MPSRLSAQRGRRKNTVKIWWAGCNSARLPRATLGIVHAAKALAWLEGADYVTQALQSGWEIVEVVYDADKIEALPENLSLARRSLGVGGQVLSKITGKSNPQPVLGIL
ncbi:MAG: hypothetical protein LRY76_03210, partial [Alphaproteobacteria bacterium]|nr:hypothetical protein [Alphaproteobacteria bacterium]